MKKILVSFLFLIFSGSLFAQYNVTEKPVFDTAVKPGAVKTVMKAVADWEIEHYPMKGRHPLDWTNGALYTGMMAWAQMADSGKYLDWLISIGKKYHWQPYFRMYNADDLVVAQMYLDMYRIKKDEDMLIPIKARIDWIIDNPSDRDLILTRGDGHSKDRWSWCDALFMAPPVFAKLYAVTGDKKYVKFMDKEFKDTYDFLYDKEEHLFYRDRYYLEKREKNGEKVFWGRGNGWVMGGLVRILEELPENSKYRKFYLDLFKEMSARIVTLQDENGAWHSSLLDPESYKNPEISGTAFFCYAFAYGVNEGILDRDTYLPSATKAWKMLVSSVHPDGKLGWVQPIGYKPESVTKDMTANYGAGAFLLAGSEMYKLKE